MAQPYVGEIRMFAGNFAPAGWMFCEGQILPIAEYEVLFQLIGTTYGGDGQETFNLPDLRGRLPLHQGTSSGSGITYTIGEAAGVEDVTLTVQQIPQHTHSMYIQPAGTHATPKDTVPAASPLRQYTPVSAPQTNLPANMVVPAGGSQPHTNFMPYLCVDFIISLFGIFPSQT